MALFSSLSDLVKHFESGGDYSAQNPKSSASGAYQQIDSTFQKYSGLSGSAKDYSSEVQDAAFENMVSQRGLADYTCSGCNPQLTQYVAQNSYVKDLPIFSTTDPQAGDWTGEGDFSSADQGNQSVWQYFFGGSGRPSNLSGLPGAGGSINNALNSAAAGGSWFDTLFKNLQNLAGRTGLIVLGVVLVGAAAAAFAFGDRKLPSPGGLIKRAVSHG